MDVLEAADPAVFSGDLWFESIMLCLVAHPWPIRAHSQMHVVECDGIEFVTRVGVQTTDARLHLLLQSIRGHDVSDLVEPCGSSSMLMRDPGLTISSAVSYKG
jgi:hypothetical protein